LTIKTGNPSEVGVALLGRGQVGLPLSADLPAATKQWHHYPLEFTDVDVKTPKGQTTTLGRVLGVGLRVVGTLLRGTQPEEGTGAGQVGGYLRGRRDRELRVNN
jgi:hypothetical protein